MQTDPAKVAASLTKAEVETLMHSLGVRDCKRAPETFMRSHFVTDDASVDHPHCMALLAAGLMTRRPKVQIFGGMDCFNVTGRGEAVMREILKGQSDNGK